ncbi:MAG: hypothetical protein GF368_01565 [Candidatus Aenigmarchaeota archaeon]|nr:hypothetical protein [Candidatus Aenigmarchaeota archaeon]
MNFNKTILATEMEKIQKTENIMYKYYDDLLKELKNPKIKERVRFLRDQELGHIKMMTNVIAILSDYILRD